MAVLLFLAVQVVSLLHPRVAELHAEESATTALAQLMGWLPPSGWIPYVYRPHCGGCIAEAFVARGLFAALGPTLLTWRLVALAFGALLAWSTFRLAGALGGRVAAWTALAVLLAPPTLLVTGTLITWGNHFESAALGLTVLALGVGARGPRDEVGVGVQAGCALVFSWAALPAVATWGLWLVIGRRWRALLGFASALPTAAVLWGAQVALGAGNPFGILRGDTVRVTDVGRWAKVLHLVRPRTLEAVFGTGSEVHGAWAGVAVALLGVLVAAWTLRPGGRPEARLPAAAALVWLVAFVVSPFALEVRDVPLQIPVAHPARYALPLVALLPPIVGLAAADLVGRRAFGTAAGLLVGVLVPGLAGRWIAWQGPVTTAHLGAPAIDVPFVRTTLLAAAPADPWRWPCAPGARDCRDARAYVLGVVEGAATPPRLVVPEDPAERPGWALGVGAGLGRRAAWSDGPSAVGAALVAAVAPLPEDLRGAALAEAARVAPEDLVLPTRFADLDPAWARALTARDGTLVAGEITPTFRPPPLPPDLLPVWAEAFGRGVGTRYGDAAPALTSKAPTDDDVRGAFLAGVRVARRTTWSTSPVRGASEGEIPAPW